MKTVLSMTYALFAYALFLGTILYAIGFVAGIAVPKTIDSGAVVPLGEALLVNAGLLTLFAAQHSIMARPAFKRWWTRFVPQPLERSTFVLFASLALVLLYWQWRPIPTTIWDVGTPFLAVALLAASLVGWALLVVSTFLINHFELFGLSQASARLRGREPSAPTFRTPLFYRYVRHPIYLCFLIAFWCTPHMSAGHLFFALATTGYILLGIHLEERDLIGVFGDQYRRYRERVSMLLPLPRSRRATPAAPLQSKPTQTHS